MSEAVSYRNSSMSSMWLAPPSDQQTIPQEVELDTFFCKNDTLGAKSWRRSQRLSSTDLHRHPTRKIKLVKGSVLSVDYPVPSAIKNSIQPVYRDSEDGFPEEFATLRCMSILGDLTTGMTLP